MYRKPVDKPGLETLIEERDQLKVELSLLMDREPQDQESITRLKQAILDADNRVRLYYRRP